MFAGQAITGAVLSTKSMCCVHTVVLPQSSEIVQTRSIGGSGTHAACCGPATSRPPSLNVIVTAGSQLSVAVGEPVCSGSEGSPHWTWASTGHATVGGVVSTNSIVWTHVDELPHASVA